MKSLTPLPLVDRYYVYGYYDLDGQPFYIGKGCGERCYYHLYKSQNKKKGVYYNPRKSRKINLILKQVGSKNFIENNIKILHSELSEKEALEKEAQLIKKYGRLDLKTGILTNLTDGGEYCIGSLKKTQSHREKLSKALTGHKRSIESCSKQSDKIKGSGNPMHNKKHSEEAKNKIRIANSKPIVFKGVRYQSISDASRQLCVSRTTVMRWMK